MRTKLPELSDVHVEQEVRDRDSEQKSKSKTYADTRRGASYSEVLPGDQVLVQQEKRDKLSTRFDPKPRNYYRTVIHQVHRRDPLDSKVQYRLQMLRNLKFQMLSNPELQLFLNRWSH